MTSDEQFLRATVTQVPALRPVLDQHLEDEYDELNPHMLMSRIQEWAVDHVGDEPVAVQRLLQLLEAGVTSGDELVENLIVISFLEHLPRGGEPGSDLRSALPSALARELRELEQGRAAP